MWYLFMLFWGMQKNAATSENILIILYIVKNTFNFMTQQFYAQVFTKVSTRYFGKKKKKFMKALFKIAYTHTHTQIKRTIDKLWNFCIAEYYSAIKSKGLLCLICKKWIHFKNNMLCKRS